MFWFISALTLWFILQHSRWQQCTLALIVLQHWMPKKRQKIIKVKDEFD